MLDVYLPGLLLAWGAYGLGILSPGPNVLAVMGTSMEDGRRAGVTLAAGMISGTLVWGTVTLLGLTALLAVYASALTIIKFAGAAYLLWLACKSFRSALVNQSEAPAGLRGGHNMRLLYIRGLAIQLTNPKAALTWIAIMSLAVHEGSPVWVGLAVVAGCFGISLVGHTPMRFCSRRHRSAACICACGAGFRADWALFLLCQLETGFVTLPGHQLKELDKNRIAPG